MQPDQITDYVRRVALAEDEAILDAVLAGAAQDPPWEVHDHAS